MLKIKKLAYVSKYKVKIMSLYFHSQNTIIYPFHSVYAQMHTHTG